MNHTAVVRRLTTARINLANTEAWPALATLHLSPSWNLNRTRVVVFVQDKATNAVLGAATADLSSKSSM